MIRFAIRRRMILAGGAALLLLTAACGYHTAGSAVRLPSDLHTLYVPGIANASQSYRVGTVFTEALIRELRERTNYRIITTNDGSADATLSGTITSVSVAPLTFDSQPPYTITSSMVVVSLNAHLVAKNGKMLWNNPNFLYRSQYQESINVASFFEEATPAVQRMANSFAKTLVGNILEAF